MMRRFRFIFAISLILIIPAAARAHGDIASRLSGRVLLEVERHGEAWYVSPADGRRYFLGAPDDAWRILSAQGLGISDADIARVPAMDEEGDAALARRLAGRILLQVESRGEAWYVDPTDLRRYRLATPAETFSVLRERGLGISDADIALLPREGETPDSVHHDVPFISQAPLGEWNDGRQQEACEEAAVLMAMAWANNAPLDPHQSRDAVVAMSDWERSSFGYYQDTSAADTLDRLMRAYSGFGNATLKKGVDADDLKDLLRTGDIAVVPINGRALGNPHYDPPGPLRHMLVVTGYDADTDRFFVHDPGTRHGEDMSFEAARLMTAIGDYASGRFAPIPAVRAKDIIVVTR